MSLFSFSKLKFKLKLAFFGKKRYKTNAWLSEKSSSIYFNEVEHDFFYKITWPLIEENLKLDVKNIFDLGAGTGRLTQKLIDFYNQRRLFLNFML